MAPLQMSTIRRLSNLQSEPSKLALYYLPGPNATVHFVRVPIGDPTPTVEQFMCSRSYKARLLRRQMDYWKPGKPYTIWYFDQKNGNNFPPNGLLQECVGVEEGY
ncbi:hypothetical protein AAF712_010206 [Marasmius tenuissimus]|uniref:Uncharacterized protein n=1 Tax=Marasmius tenuissimus TaxID=585030 RepID=A0ABR2ZNP7_9AGAR